MEKMQFTHDMVETMLKYFMAYAVDGVVTLERTEQGVWLKNPDGSRQFLGQATYPKGFTEDGRRLH